MFRNIRTGFVCNVRIERIILPEKTVFGNIFYFYRLDENLNAILKECSIECDSNFRRSTLDPSLKGHVGTIDSQHRSFKARAFVVI